MYLVVFLQHLIVVIKQKKSQERQLRHL